MAAELAAEMLGDYERARDGAREIRVEETTSPGWDDVVVHRTHHSDKWQVKRQLAPMAVAEAKKIIASVCPAAAPGAAQVRLHIGLATLVPVGTGKTPVFEFRRLADLCDDARAPNVDAAAFTQVHKDEAAFKFVVATLPSTTPTATIVAALANLFVRELGMEDAIRARAIAHLNDLFTNAGDVVTQLHNWLIQHSDGLVQIDSNVLYAQVIDQHAKHDASRSRWVHFSRNGTSRWEARGPVALTAVVESAWSESGRIRVQVGSEPFMGEAAVAPLARLLLHRSHGSSAEAAHGVDWQVAASKLCGETLGLASHGLPLSCAVAPAAHPHPPRSDLTTTEFAAGLTIAMDEHVWRDLLAAVPKTLQATLCADGVRSAALALWDRWVLQLATGEQRANFCRSMLVTADESRRVGFDAAVRSGPLLVKELARAMTIALAIGVGFEAAGTSVAVLPGGRPQNLLIASLSAHLIALTIASHPRSRQPCRFAEDPTEMLSDETGMAILAGVEASALELYGIARDAALPFHATDSSASNLRHRGSPVALLTASPRLLQAMNQSVDAVRQHVVDQLQQMALDRNNELREAVAGEETHG